MFIIGYVVLFLIASCFWDLMYLVLGYFFVRYPRTHFIGLRMLAMSFFTRKRVIPSLCKLDCNVANCRNWTCPSYRKIEK